MLKAINFQNLINKNKTNRAKKIWFKTNGININLLD